MNCKCTMNYQSAGEDFRDLPGAYDTRQEAHIALINQLEEDYPGNWFPNGCGVQSEIFGLE